MRRGRATSHSCSVRDVPVNASHLFFQIQLARAPPSSESSRTLIGPCHLTTPEPSIGDEGGEMAAGKYQPSARGPRALGSRSSSLDGNVDSELERGDRTESESESDSDDDEDNDDSDERELEERIAGEYIVEESKRGKHCSM